MQVNNTLAEFFGTDKVDFKEIDQSAYVHMIVDVQACYCKRYPAGRGNRHTEYIAEKIAKQKPLIEEFGIRSLIMFQDGRNRGHELAGDGLYKIRYNPKTDMLSPKRGSFNDSGFKGSKAEAMLREDGVRNVLVSGFNAGACVLQVVQDLLTLDFNVLLLTDCIGQDMYHESKLARASVKESLKEMQDFGAYATTSKQLRQFLAEFKQQP